MSEALVRLLSNKTDPDLKYTAWDEILGQALKEEHEFRISEEAQRKFYEAELSMDIDWLIVISKVQEKVL
jgi:hypothetical protein